MRRRKPRARKRVKPRRRARVARDPDKALRQTILAEALRRADPEPLSVLEAIASRFNISVHELVEAFLLEVRNRMHKLPSLSPPSSTAFGAGRMTILLANP
jgi:hypothetical protein